MMREPDRRRFLCLDQVQTFSPSDDRTYSELVLPAALSWFRTNTEHHLSCLSDIYLFTQWLCILFIANKYLHVRIFSEVQCRNRTATST